MRQDTRQAMRAIKERVRSGSFTLSEETVGQMVAGTIDEEDLKRAVSTARLMGIFSGPSGAGGYILQGFGMDEELIEVLCRTGRERVEIVGLSRL